ncbi:MAG: hypothetical protein ABIH03_13615 [Pseudomonadota bacterium]
MITGVLSKFSVGVADQLKTLMADGIATMKLRTKDTLPAYTEWPLSILSRILTGGRTCEVARTS